MAAILIVVITFIGMEGVAWLAHKYVMHGFLWSLHKDHHKKDPSSFFEKNDYFFLIFAIPGMLCLALGSFIATVHLLLFVGIGITIYGFAYFMVHEVFIHQRFKWLRHTNNVYFSAIRRAHKRHHKHLDKEDGECFGMLWVPWKYYKEAMKQQQQRS